MKNPNFNLFNLKGRTAIVTGALGVLGRPFCKGLSEFGANVVVTDLLETDCKKFAEELSATYGTKALGIKCDVTSPNEVSYMVEKTVQSLGKIDILHNNAGGRSTDLDAFFCTL